MRAAVVYFGEKHKKHLQELSEAFARGMVKQNVSVEVFDAKDFNRRLSVYKLVVIGTESTGTFGGGIPQGLPKFLKSAGPLMNVRSYAFVAKKGLRCEKSLHTLMKTLEGEGSFIVCSDVLSGKQAAEVAGVELST